MKLSLKIYFIVFISLIHIGNAQNGFHKTWENQSYNGDYVSKVSGSFYEGFSGPQIVQLYFKDSLLWEMEMERRGLHLPCVSNDGNLAITKWSQFFLYDKLGQLIWNYDLGSESFCPYWDEHIGIAQLFSEDSQYYVAVIYNSKAHQTFLICDSIVKKNEKWRISLGDYKINRINQLGPYIVLHNFYTNSTFMINKCYVIDYSGSIVWEFERDLKTNLFKEITYNKKDDKIRIIFKDKIVEHKLSKPLIGPVQ